MTDARRYARTAAWFAALLLTFGGTGELWSRLDDYVFRDIALLARPNDDDLRLQEGDLERGRPGGRFEQFRLNEYGFRGPALALAPTPGCPRVAIVGASEIMGYFYESAGHEAVEQLRQQIAPRGCVEILNAAVWGQTNRKAIVYWHKWLVQFRPQWVVLYPSPVLYLSENALAPPARAPVATSDQPRSLAERRWVELRDAAGQSRFLARLSGIKHWPDWVEDWRNARTIERARAQGKMYTAIPLDRLQAFDDDLGILVDDILASGAKPILFTHAEKLSRPVLEQDQHAILKYCSTFPRASTETFIEFNDRANDAIRARAHALGLPLVDAAAAMNGHREWFGDLVHFNDDGAHEMATVLAGAIADNVLLR